MFIRAILLLILCPTMLLAQVRYREAMNYNPFTFFDPDPYQLTPHYDYLNPSGLQKVVMVSSNKWDNFARDTVQVEYYNKKGLKTQSIKYEHGVADAVTNYTYDEMDNLTSWENHTFKRPDYISKVLFFYNGHNKVIKTNKLHLRGADTSSHQISTFQYEGDKLLMIETLSNGLLDYSMKHTYEKGKLIRSENTRAGASFTDYAYNEIGKLIQVKDTVGRTLKLFEYGENGRLTRKLELTSSNIATKDYQINNYTYQADGKLQLMNSTYKELYQNTTFEYNGDKYKSISIKTNGKSAYMAYYIPYKLESRINYPLEYEEQWQYGARGNLLNRKYYANGELFQEITYTLEYY